MQKIIRKICNWIEKFSINRVNIIKTIYINYRCLPYSQAKCLPIVVYGSPKFHSLRGKIVFSCDIKKGLLEINKTLIYAPNLQTVPTQLVIDGEWVIKGCVEIGKGSKILINAGASIIMGDKVKVSDMCNIVCYKKIHISEAVRITHRCQVVDTNNHFVADLNTKIIHDCKRPIHIGKYVWIGNTTTVSAGAVIPDNCIVASNSLINKNYGNTPEFTLFGGIPAKPITTGLRRVYNQSLELKLIDYYLSHDDTDPYRFSEDQNFDY